jgi:hypothetical protein
MILCTTLMPLCAILWLCIMCKFDLLDLYIKPNYMPPEQSCALDACWLSVTDAAKPSLSALLQAPREVTLEKTPPQAAAQESASLPAPRP